MNGKWSTLATCFWLATACALHGQGTFQNLDFEYGVFVSILGDPYDRVQFAPAMPGWDGYVGTNQINWILHNNQFLSTAGIAIYGPDNPSPDYLQGHFFLLLQSGQDPSDVTRTVNSGITQSGTIPTAAQSIRFLYPNPFAIGVGVAFNGAQIPIRYLGKDSNMIDVWGGDISSFAGQYGRLQFFGQGVLDSIVFSDQPIPEPSAISLFALSTMLLGWRLRRVGI